MSEASRELVIFDHNISRCRIVVLSVSPSLQVIFSIFTGKLVLEVVVLSIHLETPLLVSDDRFGCRPFGLDAS
jgi:hypothetical protein